MGGKQRRRDVNLGGTASLECKLLEVSQVRFLSRETFVIAGSLPRERKRPGFIVWIQDFLDVQLVEKRYVSEFPKVKGCRRLVANSDTQRRKGPDLRNVLEHDIRHGLDEVKFAEGDGNLPKTSRKALAVVPRFRIGFC